MCVSVYAYIYIYMCVCVGMYACVLLLLYIGRNPKRFMPFARNEELDRL